MIRLEIKNYNMILIEKQQKYQHYYQAKLININILRANKCCLLLKFTYSPLKKAFKKQTKTIEDQEEKLRQVIQDHEKKAN